MKVRKLLTCIAFRSAARVARVTATTHDGSMTHFDTTGFGNGRPSTVSSLVANLPELLTAMCRDPCTLVAIADFSDFRYIQFWAHWDGTVIGEVISNLTIGENIALRPDDRDRMRRLGFCERVVGPNPNWWTRTAPGESLDKLIDRMARAVHQVFGEAPANPVTVSTWESDAPCSKTPDQSRRLQRVYVSDALREAFKDF